MHQFLRRWISNNLGFSRSETNGYVVLILILISLQVIVTQIGKQPHQEMELSPEQEIILDSLARVLRESQMGPVTFIPELPVFDPNQVSYDSLVAWGVKSRVAANLIKYREAGGRYRTPEDLKKIYGMTDSIWKALSPWVVVKQTSKDAGKKTINGGGTTWSKPTVTEEKIVDINLADSLQLTKVYGIGPKLSTRIIKYRDMLGGYYSWTQLEEVYGLSPEALQNLKKQTIIKSSYRYHKINLNSLDYRQLARHPYISYPQARAITAYRDQHGPYQSVEELKNIHIIDDSTYGKVYPYLDF